MAINDFLSSSTVSSFVFIRINSEIDSWFLWIVDRGDIERLHEEEKGEDAAGWIVGLGRLLQQQQCPPQPQCQGQDQAPQLQPVDSPSDRIKLPNGQAEEGHPPPSPDG